MDWANIVPAKRAFTECPRVIYNYFMEHATFCKADGVDNKKLTIDQLLLDEDDIGVDVPMKPQRQNRAKQIKSQSIRSVSKQSLTSKKASFADFCSQKLHAKNQPVRAALDYNEKTVDSSMEDKIQKTTANSLIAVVNNFVLRNIEQPVRQPVRWQSDDPIFTEEQARKREYDPIEVPTETNTSKEPEIATLKSYSTQSMNESSQYCETVQPISRGYNSKEVTCDSSKLSEADQQVNDGFSSKERNNPPQQSQIIQQSNDACGSNAVINEPLQQIVCGNSSNRIIYKALQPSVQKVAPPKSLSLRSINCRINCPTPVNNRNVIQPPPLMPAFQPKSTINRFHSRLSLCRLLSQMTNNSFDESKYPPPLTAAPQMTREYSSNISKTKSELSAIVHSVVQNQVNSSHRRFGLNYSFGNESSSESFDCQSPNSLTLISSPVPKCRVVPQLAQRALRGPVRLSSMFFDRTTSRTTVPPKSHSQISALSGHRTMTGGNVRYFVGRPQQYGKIHVLNSSINVRARGN